MRWAALLCLAACGGETGVAIEIRSEQPLASVEVFVGHEIICSKIDGVEDCELGVAWLPNQLVPPGISYKTMREKAGVEARVEAVSVGDHFEVHLQALSGYDDPRVIVIVGLDAQGTPVAVARLYEYEHAHIPTHSSERWVVTLAPARLATQSFRDGPALGEPTWRAAVWGREGVDNPAGAARCAVVQEWHEGDHEWKGSFVVPESDPDCDGESIECDEYYFNVNQGVAPTAAIACVGQSLDVLDSPCMVGATTCADGVSDSRVCTPRRPGVCVPDAVCDACSDPFSLRACVANAVKVRDDIAHSECAFHSDATTSAACSTFYQILTLGIGTEAFDVRLGTDALTKIDVQGRFTVGEAIMEVALKDFTTGKFEVFFKEGRAPAGTRQWIILGVYPLGSLGPVILVPVRLDFTGTSTCSSVDFTSSECTNVGIATDNMINCKP
jgi:hypothetical protein